MPDAISGILDLFLILSAGLLAGLVCRRRGVSTLIGYILAGAILGSGFLGLIRDEHREIEYLAEVGVLLLLFSIGLELSLDNLARLARPILVGGSVQMLAVTVPAAGMLVLAGTSWQKAVLLGLALAMSSTVLVFRALAEYGRTESPAGQCTLGVLLFQDMAVVPVLLLVQILTGQEVGHGFADYSRLIGAGAALVVGVLVLRRALHRWLVPFLAELRSPELVMLFCLVSLMAVTLAAHWAGLPAPLGALAAGLALGGNRLSDQMDALVLPFREAFAAVFFVSLGLLLDPGILVSQPVRTVLMFGVVLAIKAAAAAIGARATGLPWSASAGVGVGLAQVGEFAFVVALAGLQAGLIAVVDYQRILIVALGSLLLTPALLKLGIRWTATVRGGDDSARPAASRWPREGASALVVGIGPVGQQVTRRLGERGLHVTAMDLSPVNLHPLAQLGFATTAGDARDGQLLRETGAGHARLAVICVPDDHVAEEIVAALRAMNRSCLIIVRCRYTANAGNVRRAGADAVISEEERSTESLLDALAAVEKAGAGH